MAREQLTRRMQVVRSSSWMASAARALRLLSFTLLSTLVVGCGTTRVERDRFYPADWPDVVGAAEDCHGIEGTFANKGVLVDEKGTRRDIWFTDLWPAGAVIPTGHPQSKDRIQLRGCEHVGLALESFTYRGLHSDLNALRLVIRPGRQSARDSQAPVERCAEIRLPKGSPYPFNQAGEPSVLAYCMKSSLQVSLQWGSGGYAWLMGLAGDGSLLVRTELAGLAGAPPIVWPSMEAGWARFSKVP